MVVCSDWNFQLESTRPQQDLELARTVTSQFVGLHRSLMQYMSFSHKLGPHAPCSLTLVPPFLTTKAGYCCELKLCVKGYYTSLRVI